MILTSCHSASRLVAARRRRVATEADADGLHALMGAAMAGMLVPQLAPLPGRAWMVVFGTGTAWFGACALRSRHQGRSSWQCRYPIPHLVECIAMLYMLLAVRGAPRATGMAMPGMGTSPGAPTVLPALAVVLALFMLGYVMWTTDQLASLARASARAPALARPPQPRTLAAVPAGGRTDGTAAGRGTAGSLDQDPPPVRQVLLAPRLAACGKIAMGIAMGYMLILML
jgi:hypothetical protein